MVKQTDDARCRLRYFVFRSTLRAFWHDVIMALRSSGHHASAGLEPAQGPPVATYQTRVSGYVGLDREAGDAALATYAELYGQVERKLFAEVAAERSAAPLKSDYIREHGIPARLFNAVRVSLDGKVSAVRAAQRLRVDSLERRIAPGERQVAKAEEQGKYLVIEGVRFAYGHEQVLAALQSNANYAAYRREHGENAARATRLGQAISYRFKRDGKGWRVFVSTRMMDVPVVTDRKRGTIGVDLNADHLAVAETNGSGNYVNAWQVPLVTYGKSTHQAEALIGDAVAGVVQYACEVGKPIVIERLDFRQKKAALEGESRKYSRMLSSFSYGKIKAYFISRGYREGVEIHQVNPAYSSVIGRVKFIEWYGLTVHQAAALVLARRSLGFSERIPRRWVCPIGNGVQVAFTVPVRKRVKHVWTYWGAVSGQLRPALAAQHRLGKRRRGPNPVQAVVRGQTRGVG